jgi:hypothetical protein
MYFGGWRQNSSLVTLKSHQEGFENNYQGHFMEHKGQETSIKHFLVDEGASKKLVF